MAPYREVFASEGIAAFAFIPLVHQHQLLGKFMLYWDRPREFSRHEEDLASTIASHVAQAFERASIQEAERVARERLARLQQVTAALNQAATREEMNVCLPAIREAVGVPFGSLYRLDEAASALELIRFVGLPPAMAAPFDRIPLTTRMGVTDAVRRRAPGYYDSREALESSGGSPPGATNEIEARAALPLLVGDRLLGALGVGFSGVRAISEEERSFLVAIAD